NPLKGALVSLKPIDRVALQTRTNERGEYILSSLPSGPATLSVSEIGFRKNERAIYVNPDQKAIHDVGLQVGYFTNAPALFIRGSVKDGRSRGIGDVTVVARSVFASEVVVFSRTSKEGSFELEIPGYGEYFVYATKLGQKTHVQTLRIEEEKSYEANFVLVPLR
ncbi:MAG: carboxypeptidase-like regulatory domain-containing protein, partial [Pyrinomonadaceae bacterium]